MIEKILSHIDITLIGLLGIILIYIDLRYKTKLLREEHEFRVKQFEEEYNFSKKKFEEEKADRDERRKFNDTQQNYLKQFADKVGEKVSKDLRENVGWASDALKDAKLGPYSRSIFGDRSDHYFDEKVSIANHFVPLLLWRCKEFVVKHNKEVYLLIDSGTTLFPFFEKIAKECLSIRADREDWIDNLHIATNNLPGVQKLMEAGRVNPNNRYSPLAIKCHLFQGEPLTIYSAVTGEDTTNAVSQFREKAKAQKDCVFIALVVGNWIRIKHSSDLYFPIPLARGFGHREFKEALIDNAEETYIITPLGKIFLDAKDVNDVNSLLGFNETHQDPEKKPYSEVRIKENKENCVKLVTTTRSEHDILFKLNDKIQDRLNTISTNFENFVTAANSKQIPNIQFPFDKLSKERFLQIETEFPHPHTRNEEFMKRFFVPRLNS